MLVVSYEAIVDSACAGKFEKVPRPIPAEIDEQHSKENVKPVWRTFES